MTTPVKISQLPAAGALAGTELLPVVQDGATVAVTAAQLRAGLAAATHAHAIADVAELQTVLDGKAATATALTQGKHTIWVPAAIITPRATSGAAAGMVESAAYKIMRQTMDFDAANLEFAQFIVAMPKSWDKGTLSFQALWTFGSGSGGVTWGAQALAVGDGDPLDSAFGTYQLVTDTAGTAGGLHQTVESAPLTVAGPPMEGDAVVVQVFRSVNHVNDTLAADAALLGVRLFYTRNAGNDA